MAYFAPSGLCTIEQIFDFYPVSHIALRQIAVVLCDPRRLNKKISHAGGNSESIIRRAAHVRSIERNAKMQFGHGIGQLVTRLDKI